MSDQVVILPPDTFQSGKKVDVSELTVGDNTVERQRVVLADPNVASRLANVNPDGSLSIGSGIFSDILFALQQHTVLLRHILIALDSDISVDDIELGE